MNFKFKEQNPNAEKRLDESNKIRNKYADRGPVICEKDPHSKMGDIDKTKYLVPVDLTVSQFLFTIRKRLALEKSASLFLLVNGKIAIQGEIKMGEIYDRHKDLEDGFLYIFYASEMVFG